MMLFAGNLETQQPSMLGRRDSANQELELVSVADEIQRSYSSVQGTSDKLKTDPFFAG